MSRLADDEIRERLSELPGWRRDGKYIRRSFDLGGFQPAIDFVNRIAERAEAADHHPDIDIRFDRVDISLSTHSAEGLTERDFNLAREIDEQLGEDTPTGGSVTDTSPENPLA